MIEVKQGNVVDAVLNNEVDFIMHITNGQQKMASGVAKEIRQRMPSAYTNYMVKDKNIPCISFSEDYKCVNLTAQQYYGYDGKRYLKYNWLLSCLAQLDEFSFDIQDHFGKGNLKIGIPFNMGCDRAGGDWDTVCEILEYYLGHFEIIAYKL